MYHTLVHAGVRAGVKNVRHMVTGSKFCCGAGDMLMVSPMLLAPARCRLRILHRMKALVIFETCGRGVLLAKQKLPASKMRVNGAAQPSRPKQVLTTHFPGCAARGVRHKYTSLSDQYSHSAQVQKCREDCREILKRSGSLVLVASFTSKVAWFRVTCNSHLQERQRFRAFCFEQALSINEE